MIATCQSYSDLLNILQRNPMLKSPWKPQRDGAVFLCLKINKGDLFTTCFQKQQDNQQVNSRIYLPKAILEDNLK